MRRLLAAACLALALGGSAQADTFVVVQPAAPLTLPSAETPNLPGSLFLPTDVWASSAAPPRELAYEELHALWQRAGASYGIPWQVLAAINKIESNFGRNMGPSSAGAVGWMQFMPDTWLRWGTDASGDGVADPWDPEDGVYSAARYLAAAGGRDDLQRAVFAYNHAQWYVDEVLQLAALYGDAGPDVAFELDRLQLSLEEAEAAVAAVSEALGAAEEVERGELEVVAALQAKLDRPDLLLSDKLELQRKTFQADLVRADATAEVERLRDELRSAEEELAAARDGSRAAAFAQGADSLLGGPSYADSYVFPVGGGPAIVSVGAEHHDYPAADIAAPQGTPVYALADATVERSWHQPSGRCGIGLTLRTGEGLRWTYCHLSYLDPAVVPGSALAGGSWLGLVGSTGNSSGPHLHLELEPADAYPQQMRWFRRFADVAFRWEDEELSDAASASGPVFAVVPPSPEPQDVVAFSAP